MYKLHFAKSKSQAGFTLIELSIAITIIVALFTTGVVRYIDFNRTQTTKNVGQTVKNNLRDIQAKASTGMKPTTCNSSSFLETYRTSFTSTTTYVSQAICNNGISSFFSGPIVTYRLPANFSFSPLPSNFDFYPIGRGTSLNVLITIAGYQNPTRYYRLCVSRGGDIKDCGYQSGSAPTCSCP